MTAACHMQPNNNPAHDFQPEEEQAPYTDGRGETRVHTRCTECGMSSSMKVSTDRKVEVEVLAQYDGKSLAVTTVEEFRNMELVSAVYSLSVVYGECPHCENLDANPRRFREVECPAGDTCWLFVTK